MSRPNPLFYSAFILWASCTAAQDFRSTISDCWKDHSHVEMSACVNEQEKSSDFELLQLESELRFRISSWSEEPRLKEQAAKTFDEGARQFLKYRENECNFIAAVAAGGNAAHDLRSACHFQLNLERVHQLQLIRDGWFKVQPTDKLH